MKCSKCSGERDINLENLFKRKKLHEVFEFSFGLGNVMGRENVPDIKNSIVKGLGERKC